MKLTSLAVTFLFATSGIAFASPYGDHDKGPQRGRLRQVVRELRSHVGSYKGKGLWRTSDGKKGIYQVQSQLKNGDVDIVLDFGDIGKREGIKEIAMKVKIGENGFLTLDNEKPGAQDAKGYCLRRRCIFTTHTEEGVAAATLRLARGRLVTLGYVENDNGRSMGFSAILRPQLKGISSPSADDDETDSDFDDDDDDT